MVERSIAVSFCFFAIVFIFVSGKDVVVVAVDLVVNSGIDLFLQELCLVIFFLLLQRVSYSFYESEERMKVFVLPFGLSLA